MSLYKEIVKGAISVFIGAGFIVGLQNITGEVSYSESNNINKVYDVIDKYYYGEEDYSHTDIMTGLYNGLFSDLDIYSSFLSKDEYDEMMSGGNDLCGIGVQTKYSRYDESFRIVKVYPDSPAEIAGLKKNDVLSKIDGEYISEMKYDDVTDKIRGESGTEVKITVFRGDDELELTAIRRDLHLPKVYGEKLTDNTGYIKILDFMGSADEDFVNELKNFGDVSNLIIDLRGNSGGEVAVLNNIMNNLVNSGTLVTFSYKDGHEETYEVNGVEKIPYNYVVLCDEDTASCGEIMSQYMKDMGYILIGERTYGKGIAQMLIPVDDIGYAKVTVAKLYSPNGVCWNTNGVEPNIELEYKYLGDDYEESNLLMDNQVLKALEVLGDNS